MEARVSPASAGAPAGVQSARASFTPNGTSCWNRGFSRPTLSTRSTRRTEPRVRLSRQRAGRAAQLFELADLAFKARNKKPTTISPLASEAVRKIDAIFMGRGKRAGLPRVGHMEERRCVDRVERLPCAAHVEERRCMWVPRYHGGIWFGHCAAVLAGPVVGIWPQLALD
jgi:hypothetical protein